MSEAVPPKAFVNKFLNGKERIDKVITLQVAEWSSFFGVPPIESKHRGWVDFKLHFVEDEPQTHLECGEVEQILSVTLGDPHALFGPHVHFPNLQASELPLQTWFPPQEQTPRLHTSLAPEQTGPPPQVHLPLTQTSVTLETQMMSEHKSKT